jgi:hypothetical protein
MMMGYDKFSEWVAETDKAVANYGDGKQHPFGPTSDLV